MHDVTQTESFVAGRKRGADWASSILASGVDIKTALDVGAIEAALGSDRGDTAHGFLRGVRDVLMGLPPHARPNVIIEVASAAPSVSPHAQRRGIFKRIRAASYAEDD